MNEKNLKEINKATDLISSLIHEYLYKKDYLKTLESFQQELSDKIKSGIFYSLINNNKSLYDSESLLNYFESGNKQKFMEQWKYLIPNNLKLTEPTLFKLDFNIQIYFSIYPILKPNSNLNNPGTKKNLKQNMEEFKIYLEKNNTEQFKTPEFLPYYALPYIPDPRNNSAYSNLFSPEWKKCLKEQIQRCLDYYSPSNFNKFPILYDLARGKKVITINNNISDNLKNKDNCKNRKGDDSRIRELITGNRIIREENNNLRIKDEKNKKFFLDSQKTWCNLALDILSYSFDLITIYYKVTNNQKDDIVEEINNKLLKYQNFLVKNFEELDKNNKNLNEINNIVYPKELTFSKNDENNNFNSNDNKQISNYSPNKINYSFKPVDEIMNSNLKSNINLNKEQINESIYNLLNSSNRKENKIKNKHKRNEEIINNIKRENPKKLNYYENSLIDMRKFIQALNHQIYVEDEKIAHIFQEIRLRIYNKKRKELRELTLFEIFFYDILGALSKSSTLFKQLLSNSNLNLEVMKLVNSLANFNKGKNYLLSKNTLIEDIVKCMIAEKNDTELRQNCLGAIQKFTLRNEPQNKLIELNVIHYLVDIFTYQSDSLSDYSIEYGLALLMNLSLRKEGKEKFEAVAEKILCILMKFLNYENIQILTCINGMLYSLLKKKKIREFAKNFGVEKKLIELKKFNDEQINKQVKYIIDELNNYTNDNNEYIEDEKEETFVEEDINAKEDLDTIYNEYPETNINDENYLKEHFEILSEFIISDKELELIEKQKITNYMNEDINMIKGLLANSSNRSNDSSFRKDENNNINNIDKDNEEEIVNTNINVLENNEEENEENNEDEGEKFDYGVINEKNNDFDDIYGRPDDGFAFKTKDKLKRTPPRQVKYD